MNIALIGKTYELLLSLGSRSSSLFRLLRKSPKVSESTFFDICLSKNQSSYCNTHLKDIAHIAYLAYFNRLGQFTVQDVVIVILGWTADCDFKLYNGL